ncbi:excinuclease ABC subunit UvrB [Saprospira sp. CCB-QB6]|uniref:excinuclease ABC subunit UvrB n=1 Tax=Saprospira sp. CCB-QB6 TaxID=3023936 RepID=UPI00234A64F8|nr:excinuclease ABC subunit UvrB [Saprospira sp. CCB-QB6]WCL82752.1 excinuclease ABC subunit UvrB [Saprospira sp. CCB-QB6]
MQFEIHSPFSPAGDQPKAIEKLVEAAQRGDRYQCLLGVTGSGKTFTMANMIKELQKPTLILTHNKTLTAQLYGEFKQFFPNNAVEYFVSYYDYYQPEAYVPSTDTYIEKDLAINDEVDKLRLRATSQLLSGRRDIVVVASVSCIYGMGNPEDYKKGVMRLEVGQNISRNSLLYQLVDSLYARSENSFERGEFRVRGDTLDINLPYTDYGLRLSFFGDEIDEIERIDTETGKKLEDLSVVAIFPANLYVAPKDRMQQIIRQIEDELREHYEYMEEEGKHLEAKRLRERVNMDLEMMRQLGYCSGVENYSRYFDGRQAGARPFCLLDYFPEDFLMIVDESHVTMPQFRAMYSGDRARKMSLIEHGFRLPSALDNRPLNFMEFESLMRQVVFVSATPAAYELEKTEGEVVEQIVRPTGLLDPPIELRPSINQVDDLMDEIRSATRKDQRVLVTTITKRMSEELAKYLAKYNIRCRYIHSDVDTLERVEILRDLRLGEFDVLIGINLLREGLDLPEVALVAILDADKEGFLRNERSLTQTAGRAARNANGRVIFYADKITPSMQRTMDETNRRRSIQMAYNEKHGITPTTVLKSKDEIRRQSSVLDGRLQGKEYEQEDQQNLVAEDPILKTMSKEQLEKAIEEARRKMKEAAKATDFLSAAQYRDQLFELQDLLKKRFGA